MCACFVQGESSTGEHQSLAGLGELCHKYNTVLVCACSAHTELRRSNDTPIKCTEACCRVRAAQECTRAWQGWVSYATSTTPCCWWTLCAAWEACLSLPTLGVWTACIQVPRNASAHHQVQHLCLFWGCKNLQLIKTNIMSAVHRPVSKDCGPVWEFPELKRPDKFLVFNFLLSSSMLSCCLLSMLEIWTACIQTLKSASVHLKDCKTKVATYHLHKA